MDNISFRGEPIPNVIRKESFKVADSQSVIDKIVSSNNRDVSIEAVNFSDNVFKIANVKLTTGDIVPIETAIALAQNKFLKGYTTGKTMRGGRTLRSIPSTDENNVDAKGLYDLPRF